MKVRMPATRRAKSLSPPNCNAQVYREFSAGIRSGDWAYGKSCHTLEAAIAKELGLEQEHVIATASCSHALAAALNVLYAEAHGPRVVPLTWPATYAPRGETASWADFENYSLQLPEVSIAVDLWGTPAFRSGPVKIIDAAHRFLGPEHGPALRNGDTQFVTYSFAPQKEISCIMGGALVMADAIFRPELLRILNGGVTGRVYQGAPSVPKGLMPSPVARMIRAKMHEHETQSAQRRRLLAKYKDVLGERLINPDGSGHLAVAIADDTEQRWEWRRNLTKHGFQHGHHYPMSPEQKEAAPVAASISDRIITLPLHYHMTERDVVEVLRRMVGG